MSDAADLAARIRLERQQWFELDDPPRRALRWRLPDWEERLLLGGRGLEPMRVVVGLVEGWRGFTAADVEPGTPAGEPVTFTPELWQLAAAEHVEWLTALSVRVYGVLKERAAAREASSGN